MNNLVLLALAISLSFNLIRNAQIRLLIAKNNNLLATILNVVSESRGVTRIDENTIRLFSYNQPHHKKAIQLLISEGLATEKASGTDSIDGIAQLKAA